MRKVHWLSVSISGVLGVLSVLLFHSTCFAAEPWRDSNYPKRMEITIDYDDLSPAADIANFPVLIKLTDTQAIASADIISKRYVFYEYNSATTLSFEEESYTDDAGSGYANFETWVKVSNLIASPTGDENKIWLYYGDYDPGSDQDDATNVWDSNFKGVWHLPDGTTLTANDSTSNANNGTVYNAVAGTGKIDGAGSFDGNGDYVRIPDSASLDGFSQLTIAAWVWGPSGAQADNWATIIRKEGRPYFIVQNNTANQLSYGIEAPAETYPSVAGATGFWNGNWRHVAMTYDGSYLRCYEDGIYIDSVVASGNLDDSGNPVLLGSQEEASNFLNGSIDEVRVSSSARSADWIAFAHANMGGQADNELTWGSEELVDTTAPTVSTLSPADNATGVAVGSNLVITFSEVVDAETGNINLYKTAGDVLVQAFDVTADITGSGTDTITANPTSDLDGETAYYVQIDATAFDDAAGNSFAGIADTTTWNFTSADIAAPTVSTLSPADGANYVLVDSNLVITFSENVDAENGNITIKKTTDDSTVETIDVTGGQVTGSGTTTITINPSSDFDTSTGYYVQIDATAFDDAAGNSFAGIADTTTWNFTTADAVETVTWDGSVDTDWGTAGNWDLGFVPRAADNIVIADVSGGSGNNPILDQARTVNSITINSGGVLTLNSSNFTVTNNMTSNGTLTASGSEVITIGGNWDLGSGTFTAASSNVTFNRAGDVTLDPGSSSFKTVTVNKTNTTDTAKVINSNLTIGSNTLIIQNGEFEVTTDSTFNEDIEVQDGGAFISRTSLITLTFAAGINFTVESGGKLILDGGTFDKEIKLRSGTDGSQWKLILQSGSSQDIKYVDVKDSDASGGNTAMASFSIDSGNNINWSFLGGTVYDSQTGDRIKGALVTLYKADSIIYTSSPQPNPQTSDSQGRFFFEVGAGKYYLESRHKDYKDFKGEVFTISGSSVNENVGMVPLELATGQYLSIAKTVNKKTASVGDILTYTITAKNIDSSLNATGVTITDSLPHDFKYVKGTARLESAFIADPANRRTPSWSIGGLSAKQSKTLTYRVIVGPDGKLGRNKNSAEVAGTVSGSSTSAGPSVAVVDIKEGLFTKKGMIIGKVFNDIDRDGIQDTDEEGIPYVALILEDGTMVVTDEFGRYSIPDVAQGMHVLRLDQRMLPGGPLTKEGIKGPKTKERRPETEEKEENLIQRRSLGDWVKETLYKGKNEIASSPEFTPNLYGSGAPRNDAIPHYRSDIPETSNFVQVPESGTAKCNFPIRLLTLAEERLQKERHAKETQFMIVGIADGTLGYLQSSGKVENIAEGDNIGMSLEVDNAFYQSGKVVLYAKGKIKGEYLFTTRYDSTRDYHDHLYSWINPEKYYPIYGDKSTLTNDADSQGKFFIRVDKDTSYAMIGNYKTDEFTETQLSKYTRQLHGITTSIKSDDFIMSPFIPKAELSFFGAETLQEQRQDIFAGRGISGPFYLTRVPILEETEKVKLEVRDKSRYDIVLKTEAKSRDIDYELDYDTGRLMFREPIPTYDENNDPVYIFCDYEYVPPTEDDKHYITGSRGELTLFRDRLKIGSQVITEDREEYFYNLVGVDSIWEISQNTRLAGEWAHSGRTGEKEIGDALRIEGSSVLFDDKLKLQAYATQIDKKFSNPVNVTEKGIQKYGATGELDITKNLSLITDHWASRSMAQKIYDRQTKADLIYKNDALFLSTGYGFDEVIDEKDAIDDIYTHKLNLKGGVKFTENIIGSTEYSWQRELYEKEFKKEIDVLSPRIDVKLNEDTSLYARHDYTREKTRGTDKRLTNHLSSVGFMSDKDGKRSYVEYGLVGGKIEKTTFGTEEDIPINDKVTITSHANRVISKDKNEEIVGYNSRVELVKNFYVGGNFERTKTTGDTDYEETAVSITTDYLKGTDNAFGAKFEYRDAKTKREYNVGIDSKLNMDDATYLLAKAEYHRERDRDDKLNLRETKRLIGGVGYRPIDNDTLNLLAKYEYKEDLDNTSIAISDYASQIASIEGIYDITPKWELFGKYALKSALEEANDIRTHSLTDLKTAKLTYKFNPYIDVAGIYRILQNYNTDTIKQGAALEAGLTIFNHLRIATGYNFLRYDDKDYPDEDYQGVGPYVQLTYKFLDDAEKLLESREEMLKRFADESALELYEISQIPGNEKFVEEVRTCYRQAMKWYRFGKYEEALECLQQGMEAYYAAQRYANNVEVKKEEFMFHLRQGERLYEYGLKDKAFSVLEKAYEINAYDKKLLTLMSKVRDDIRDDRAKRRKILAMEREGLERIAKLEDDTELVIETVKFHLEVGKEFYSIGDYESAIAEWEEGLAIAKRAIEDYLKMKEEREILVKELESIYNMALLHWKRKDYINSKEELERGLNLIGKTLQ